MDLGVKGEAALVVGASEGISYVTCQSILVDGGIARGLL